jgi:cell division protein FtsB
VLLCFAFIVLRKTFRPVVLYARDLSEIRQVERELRQVKAENERMRKQKAYLTTSQGAQTEARKLGYVLPGEVSVTVEPSAPAKKK